MSYLIEGFELQWPGGSPAFCLILPFATFDHGQIHNRAIFAQSHGFRIFRRIAARERGDKARKFEDNAAAARIAFLLRILPPRIRKRAPYLRNAFALSTTYSFYPSGSVTSANATRYPLAIFKLRSDAWSGPRK